MEHGRALSRIRDAERDSLAEILKRGRSVDGLGDVADNAAAWLGLWLGRFPTPKRVACGPGCAWCCYWLVTGTAPEAVRIAREIGELSEGERTATLERLARADDLTRGIDAEARLALRMPCPFLSDGSCAVYRARPLVCRFWHSYSVARCRESWEQRGALGVEVSTEWQAIYEAVSGGLMDGLRAAGLDGRLLEVSAAVRIVVEAPDAAERYLAGESVFAGAEAPAIEAP